MRAVQPPLERQGVTVLHKPFTVHALLDLIGHTLILRARAQSDAAQ